MSHSPLDTVLCIQGPTASGKSSLAERLAAEYDAEIISADSMQIYRGMDIGTAKQPPEERGVPYHCIDIVEPGEAYSAALFQKDARTAIEDIRRRRKTPIMCGGTGLYVRAVLDKMDFAAGDAENPVRAHYESLARELGAEKLHALLVENDPESAALIHPNNVRRVIRAFEMLEEGESYAARKNNFKTVPPHLPSIKISLDLDRAHLYERINSRVDTMMDHGLLEEVQGLIDSGYKHALTSMQAIGYKELIEYFDGECSLDESIEQIKQATRRYAKRQLSWLRNDPDINWLNADNGITDTLVDEACTIIEGAQL